MRLLDSERCYARSLSDGKLYDAMCGEKVEEGRGEAQKGEGGGGGMRKEKESENRARDANREN